MTVAPGPAHYRLDQLGWLQFERVCSLVLELGGVTEPRWVGHCDTGRATVIDAPVVLPDHGLRLPAPVAVAVLWVRDEISPERRRAQLAAGGAEIASRLGEPPERLIVMTNLPSAEASAALAGGTAGGFGQLHVLGAGELGSSLDRHPELRARMPSVLGLRDLGPLIDPRAQARSALNVGRAQALARVFLPTRAYECARLVLARHRFAVLTGPPEMGKTAIAQMLGLAQLTAGWEGHECNEPEQLWRAWHRDRAQVFIADDAFGSTEYRPDAAERWAHALGRLLPALDDRHWLIWSSRPAPLKAGLRRIHRERGSERFPSPGEVLVDAGDLDLAEKTLILFRHAKDREVSRRARTLVRSAALQIVEHPHFTPERIRRFVCDRLEQLPSLVVGDHDQRLRVMVELELASPTEAMRTSFRALGEEHRELLIALLDAPAGLIDERELANTVRRHHSGGLSRPPSELIDRLTDHFLRLTPLGIGWVHPSWRDLVIEELRAHADPRRQFLSVCGVHGVMLALSQQGGLAGERALPLLETDSDWDLLGDRLRELLLELEEPDVARVLLALDGVLGSELDRPQTREAQGLAEYLLGATRRSWDQRRLPLPVYLLEAWYALSARLSEPPSPPQLAPTWAELHPGSLLFEELQRGELARADEWLALAQTLARYDPDTLAALRFFVSDEPLLEHLIAALSRNFGPDTRPLAESVLDRIHDLVPSLARLAARARRVARTVSVAEQSWWVPEDLAIPPSSEPVATSRPEFTREDVQRVLLDL